MCLSLLDFGHLIKQDNGAAGCTAQTLHGIRPTPKNSLGLTLAMRGGDMHGTEMIVGGIRGEIKRGVGELCPCIFFFWLSKNATHNNLNTILNTISHIYLGSTHTSAYRPHIYVKGCV